jgi:AcrR family transcriptional regulator
MPKSSIADSRAKPTGRRAAAKARTREKLLESAKRLFMTHGYDGATMRDIANDADLSTGAVFANFADKADLFNEVVLADFRNQYDRMRDLVPDDAPVAERLLVLLSSAYEFHLSQLPLLQAGISVSWSQGLNGELGDRPARRAVTGFIAEVIENGVTRGELTAGIDSAMAADIIWDCYLGNYRGAMFGDWGLDQLTDRLKSQIEMVLAGSRKG